MVRRYVAVPSDGIPILHGITILICSCPHALRVDIDQNVRVEILDLTPHVSAKVIVVEPVQDHHIVLGNDGRITRVEISSAFTIKRSLKKFTQYPPRNW